MNKVDWSKAPDDAIYLVQIESHIYWVNQHKQTKKCDFEPWTPALFEESKYHIIAERDADDNKVEQKFEQCNANLIDQVNMLEGENAELEYTIVKFAKWAFQNVE